MNIELIARALKNDQVGILPTDTVYGVVGRLFSEKAVQRMYEIKQRSLDKPVGTILIAGISQLTDLVDLEMLRRAHVYWPGPVSVILTVAGLAYAHAGIGSLPFRIPDSPSLIELLKQTGPLATSSANIEGQPPATTLAQAREYFGNQPDFYDDGGDLSDRKPSKIIVLRPDGTEEEIRP